MARKLNILATITKGNKGVVVATRKWLKQGTTLEFFGVKKTPNIFGANMGKTVLWKGFTRKALKERLKLKKLRI